MMSRRIVETAGVPATLALGLAVISSPARAMDQGACAVVASPFTLEEIVEAALRDEPGDVVRAGFVVTRDLDDAATTLFLVRIRTDEGRRWLFYDPESGERVLPTEVELDYLEAQDLAAAAVEAAVGEDGATVLKGSLRPRIFVPVYDFAVSDPGQQIALARVDAVTGEVRLVEPERAVKAKAKKKIRKKKKKRKKARFLLSGRPLPCEEVESEETEEEMLGGEE